MIAAGEIVTVATTVLGTSCRLITIRTRAGLTVDVVVSGSDGQEIVVLDDCGEVLAEVEQT